MELINNTTKTLRDDLSVEMKKGSKLSIAAACFSIYAFQELKKQLSDIDELRLVKHLRHLLLLSIMKTEINLYLYFALKS